MLYNMLLGLKSLSDLMLLHALVEIPVEIVGSVSWHLIVYVVTQVSYIYVHTLLTFCMSVVETGEVDF